MAACKGVEGKGAGNGAGVHNGGSKYVVSWWALCEVFAAVFNDESAPGRTSTTISAARGPVRPFGYLGPCVFWHTYCVRSLRDYLHRARALGGCLHRARALGGCLHRGRTLGGCLHRGRGLGVRLPVSWQGSCIGKNAVRGVAGRSEVERAADRALDSKLGARGSPPT